MNAVRHQIEQLVTGVLGSKSEFVVEIPNDTAHGDYATNAALVVAKSEGKNPREVAEDLIKKLESQKQDFIEKMEVAGPGFINFFVTKDAMISAVEQSLNNADTYGAGDEGKGKKAIVEYTDPNPFKLFHIGHLYSNAVGESIARMREVMGYEVRRACYQGDVGMHVAKTLWGILKRLSDERLVIKDLISMSLEERINYMGESYSMASEAFENDGSAQADMKILNNLAYQAAQKYRQEKLGFEPVVDYSGMENTTEYTLDDVYPIWTQGRDWSLEYFEHIYQRLGTQFDCYYFESDTAEFGLQLVDEYLKKGVFTEGDGGAIVYDGEMEGLHTRVFRNSFGLPTYEAKDLGLAKKKFEDFAYDLSTIITGNEVDEYFKVVIAALGKIDKNLAEKTTHLSHGMVRLSTGKMSSRKGNVVTGEDVLQEVKHRIESYMRDNNEDMKDEQLRQISEIATVAAVKYTLLRSNVGSDVSFDIEQSVSIEGNSGPYLLYTYARAKSILKKSEAKSDDIKAFVSSLQDIDFTGYERELMREIMYWPEVMASAAEKNAPHMVATYITELSQSFNSFYTVSPVLNNENERVSQSRVALTAAVAQVVRNGLWVLGIETTETM